MKTGLNKIAAALLAVLVCALGADVDAQRRMSENGAEERRGAVRAVTIPVTVRLPEKRAPQAELQYLDALTVFEDGEKQEILTTRGESRAPLTLAVLVQDDLVPSVVETVWGALGQIRETGVTILLVEQRAQITVSFADRTYVLSGGRVRMELTPRDAADTGRMVEAYFGL